MPEIEIELRTKSGENLGTISIDPGNLDLLKDEVTMSKKKLRLYELSRKVSDATIGNPELAEYISLLKEIKEFNRRERFPNPVPPSPE